MRFDVLVGLVLMTQSIAMEIGYLVEDVLTFYTTRNDVNAVALVLVCREVEKSLHDKTQARRNSSGASHEAVILAVSSE